MTADLHINHDGILKWCQRPFSCLEEHDTAIVENWNRTVGKKDLTYIVGDFAWRNHARWLNALNGKKILIRGNHDHMNQVTLAQFREVHDLRDLVIQKQCITLCHYKLATYNKSCYGAWHLFGHSHGRMEEGQFSFDIGVDVWNYTPVNWEIVKRKMEMKKVEVSGRVDRFAGESEERIMESKNRNLTFV